MAVDSAPAGLEGGVDGEWLENDNGDDPEIVYSSLHDVEDLYRCTTSDNESDIHEKFVMCC